MSQSNSGNSKTPANTPQASSQALLDELRIAADRARDERLKLARLFKHTADLPVNGSAAANSPATPAVPEGRLAELHQQVERLDQAVANKLESLEQAQQDIDSRTQYLESLRHTITDTTRAFVTQVEQAQHFKAHVDAAKQHVRMSAGRVVEDIRQHLGEYEAPIADRLKQLTELDEQIDRRIARMQQMHKQAGEAVDKHLLGALRSAKEQAADMAEPIKAELDKHLTAQRTHIETSIQAKIAELDVDVEEALNPLTHRFDEIVADAETRAAKLADSLPAQLEAQVDEQMEMLRATVAVQAESIVSGMDEQTLVKAEQKMRDRVAQSLDSYLNEAEQEAGGYVDGLIEKLETGRLQAIERFESSVKTIEADRSLDREQMLRKLDEEVNRLHEQAQGRVESAQKILEDAVDGIHNRASGAVDSALKSASQQLDEYEASAVQHLRAIDDGIEHGIDQSRKRVGEHEKVARKLSDEAMQTVESGIQDAQQRLASFETGVTQRIGTAMRAADDAIGEQEKNARKLSGEALHLAEAGISEAQQRLATFETGVTQRIGLATQTADDAISSVDGRLDRLENDASARVSHIVDLAMTSGQSVAESIDALAKSAERTAADAQRDLEDKLSAFEDISAEALKSAETTLRTNIGELRDASRAMIEVVAKQVKAQASHIEPQTREVIEQAEQTLRRRIGELREGAQSMVDLAVSRLEGQLDDVKRKAQHTAFQGVDQASDPQTDAA